MTPGGREVKLAIIGALSIVSLLLLAILRSVARRRGVSKTLTWGGAV
jgi:hypothetical protein